MSKKNAIDLAFDESEDLILKYLDLFKQQVLEEQLNAGFQNKDYYRGMLDGLIRFRYVISPQKTNTQNGNTKI